MIHRARNSAGFLLQALEARQLLTVSGPTATFLQPYVEGTGHSRTLAVIYSGTIDPFSLGDNNLLVTGPNGFSHDATFLGLVTDAQDSGTVAQYRIDGLDGGAYSVAVDPNGAAADLNGENVPTATIGGFHIGRHGHTVPRGGSDLPAGIQVVGTTYGTAQAAPSLDTSFGSVVAAFNFGGASSDLTGSTGATIHFAAATHADGVGPFSWQDNGISARIDSADTNPMGTASIGRKPVWESEVYTYAWADESLTITGLNPAKHYQLQFLHGDTRLGAVPYDSTNQTFSINSNGLSATTPLHFNTSPSDTDTNTTVDIAGTQGIAYVMPKSAQQTRGPSFSGVVIEEQAAPPVAYLQANSLTGTGNSRTFSVVYSDPAGLNGHSISSSNITVAGPGGFSTQAKLMSMATTRHAQHVVATYQIDGISQGGRYTISVAGNSVTDVAGESAPATDIATLRIGQHGHTTPFAL